MLNLSTFDLNLLRVFDALHRYRRVALAAKHLGLSQPTVSNSLARMRRLCGDELFMRTRLGMEPTSYATHIADPVQHALREIGSALARPAEFIPATSKNQFSIVLSAMAQMILLPQLLPRVVKEAPSVSIKVIELPRDEYLTALESGSADLAFGGVVPRSGPYRRQKLFSDRWLVMFGSGHRALARKGGAIDKETYLNARHAVYRPLADPTTTTRDWIDRRYVRKISLEVPNFLIIADMLARTDLIATVPRRFADYFSEDKRFQFAELPFKVPENELYQYWHERRSNDPAHKWLRERIAQAFASRRPRMPPGLVGAKSRTK